MGLAVTSTKEDGERGYSVKNLKLVSASFFAPPGFRPAAFFVLDDAQLRRAVRQRQV
jgi:hypothetical protein